MATNSSVGNDQEATVRGLERELRLRITEDGQGYTGSASTSPATSPATGLVHTLASCLHNHNIRRTSSSNSPRIANPAERRVCQGQVALSPSGSASTDSSMSASATGYISSSSRETESNTVPPVSSFPHLTSALGYESRPNMASASNAHQPLAADVQARVAVPAVGGGGDRGLNRNPSPMVGRGRNALAPSSTPGGAAAKPKPKRQRKSKKPHTQLIETNPENFRDMVQKLTGCQADAGAHVPSGSQSRAKVEFVSPQPPAGPGASLVRPQPKRPMDIDRNTNTQNPPAVGGLEPPSKSLISSTSSVRGPSSVQVTDQPSGFNYSYRDSYSASTSCTSKSAASLNYCMGYDQSVASFVNMTNTEDSGLLSAAEAFFACGYSPDLMVSSSSGAPLAAPLISDSSIRSLRREKSPMREDPIFKHQHGKQMESSFQDEDPEYIASPKTSHALVDSWFSPSK